VWEGGIHAAQTAKAVVTSMYEAAGTSALYIDCPIERAYRDIYAVMQHVVFASMWLRPLGRSGSASHRRIRSSKGFCLR
jgi:hypothetical protein